MDLLALPYRAQDVSTPSVHMNLVIKNVDGAIKSHAFEISEEKFKILFAGTTDDNNHLNYAIKRNDPFCRIESGKGDPGRGTIKRILSVGPSCHVHRTLLVNTYQRAREEIPLGYYLLSCRSPPKKPNALFFFFLATLAQSPPCLRPFWSGCRSLL